MPGVDYIWRLHPLVDNTLATAHIFSISYSFIFVCSFQPLFISALSIYTLMHSHCLAIYCQILAKVVFKNLEIFFKLCVCHVVLLKSGPYDHHIYLRTTRFPN